jgi:hypothetical protein
MRQPLGLNGNTPVKLFYFWRINPHGLANHLGSCWTASMVNADRLGIWDYPNAKRSAVSTSIEFARPVGGSPIRLNTLANGIKV